MVSQDNKTNKESKKSVQDRLLDAAEKLFCENGFEGTSIRDIAATAECNIAAVNYYFGGKDKLYIEVWRRHLIPIRDLRIASIDKVMSQNRGHPKLEDLLRSFADTFVGPMVDTSSASRLSKLMAREWIESHLPVKMFVDEVITPTMVAINKALVKTCPDLDESKVTMVVFSLVGQLVHLVHIKAMLERIGDNSHLPTFDVNEMINHIVKFSIAGIQAYTKGEQE